MNELTRRCLYLSKSDKQRLIRILSESLEEEEKVDDGSRFAILYKAATDVCGQGILTSSRDFNLAMGRRMIAYQMKLEGYSFVTIGKRLMRHHASVIHMVRMMCDTMTFRFKDEMEYWNKKKKKLKEYETDR